MKTLYDKFLKSSGVTTDSRNVEKNQMFFALKGELFDGNKFAQNALEKGASCAVIDDNRFMTDDRCVLVENVQETLVNLAKWHRQQLHCPVVAITGSNGKTTTKELVVKVLQSKHIVTYTKGNLNNHIGLPLTILTANKNTQILIVEMGANHQGEIDFLSNIAKPHYALITNIGKAHLEGFGSPESVFKTKTELYNYVIDNGTGIIVNADDVKLVKAAGNKICITYGTNSGNIQSEIISNVPFLNFRWSYNGSDYEQQTQLFGAYNIYNALAAVAAGIHFQVQPDDIVQAIAEYQPQNNRSQFVLTHNNNSVILDAYNANPSSMNLALEEFFLMEGKPKYAIIGEMKELGKFGKEEHLAVLEKLRNAHLEAVMLVGNEFKCFEEQFSGFIFFNNSNDLYEHLKLKQDLHDSYIIIKGSRANALEKIIDLL